MGKLREELNKIKEILQRIQDEQEVCVDNLTIQWNNRNIDYMRYTIKGDDI